MDLQAILNASDDTSDEFDAADADPGGLGVLLDDADETGTIDLEDILREDDDDDDDEENDDENDATLLRNSYHNHSSRVASFTRETASASSSSPAAADWKRLAAASPRSTADSSARVVVKQTSHHPDDWAVLHHILNEAEDDDDDVDAMNDTDWIATSAMQSIRQGSNKYDVDTIVGSFDDEDDDDDDNDDDETLAAERVIAALDSRVSASIAASGLRQLQSVFPDDPPRISPRSSDLRESSSSLSDTLIAVKALQQHQQQRSSTTTTPPPAVQPTSLRHGHHHQHGSSSMLSEKELAERDETIYRKSISYAQNLERKLLKSGHREIVSPLMVKRRLRPKIELGPRVVTAAANSNTGVSASPSALSVASQQQSTATTATNRPHKRGAGSTLTRGIGVLSSLVENKNMAGVSASLDKHATHGGTKVYCGLPTCLAFNSKFIAVGTQKGVILMYDLFEVLRQRLGGTEEAAQNAGAITSLGLARNGEAILAGYTNGTLLLWDTIRGIILRNVSDVHASTIVAVQFLRDLNCVTVDAGGLVSKLSFTKNMLWANYSMETECLLDGTAGQILALSALAPYSSVKPAARPAHYSKALRGLTLIALSSGRSSFAVAVEPKVSVLHRWARPPMEKTRVLDHEEESAHEEFLPCLSWGWTLTSGGGSVVMPVLARGWGCCLQLLSSSFPTMDSEGPAIRVGEEPVVHWPAFGVHKEIDTTVPVIALDWLNDRSLVFLNANSELVLVDVVASCLLECLDFSGFNFVYAEFSLSRSGTDASERKSCMTFQNSVKYSDDRIMILCQNELRCISIVGARRRVTTLEADGEWLEALAFALDHYENTVLNLEDRRRDPDGKRDLSRHPEFSVAKSEDEEWIAKLLVRYLNLAVENAPETSSDRSTIYSSSDTSGRIDLALSHYQMLAGVCIDYCVLIRRLDLLFGPIFRRFQSVGYIAVFLDVLEPYVLNDRLLYIAPEVMSLFVEHCKATTSIATVERCLLHMDCTIMDFDSILQLLRTNKMFSALFYVFNNGLDEYVSPLEILLDRVFDEADAGGVPLTRRPDGVLQSDFERLGYKALLYLQACFSGKSFPRGTAIEREDRVATIKMDLLKFLMQEGFKASAHTKKAMNLLPDVGHRHARLPYLRILFLVDPRGMLETIAIALDTYGGLRFATTASVSSDDWMHGGHEMRPSSIDIQYIVNNLATILIPKNPSDQSHTEAAVFEARGAVDTFLDFASNYIIDGSVRLDRATTLKIIMRFATQHTNAEDADSRSAFQRKVMDVLSALPSDAYDPDLVLQIFQETNMHRAALLLHQQVASSWSGSGEDEFAVRSRHFVSAIDSFVGDEDPEFRSGVFGYVKKECSATEEENGHGTLRNCLFRRMATLVHLDPVQTARLTAELFVDDLDKVIDSLNKEEDRGESLFLFLNVIVSGDLAAVDNAAASVLNLSMEHHHQYLSLLARLHPNLVYDYLATHDNYRTEDCLRLCQEHDIADATAYLLERTGNVSAALQLILQTLETRMMGLKRTIRGLGIDVIRKQHMLSFGRVSRSTVTLPSKQEAEIDNVRRILTVALDVCERNSGNFAVSRVGEAAKFSRGELWFNVLDRLINAKGFLRLTKEQPEHANIMANVLSELLRSTMQRMVSSVPLSDIVRKVTSDNSGSRIGELREMVEGLLAAYNFELNVFRGASTVFNKDLTAMRNVQVQVCNRGDSVNIIMDTPLVANRHEITTKLLQHPLYQKGMMQMTGQHRAVFTTNEHHASHSTESSLVEGVRKLRNRRRRIRNTSSTAGSITTSRSLSVSMMTATERLYEAHEIEPVLYSERLVGILGAAENHGRITSFYQ